MLRVAATFPRESGWSFDPGRGMRFRARRVTVKVRVVKMRGQKSQAVQAHLAKVAKPIVSSTTYKRGEMGGNQLTVETDAETSGKEVTENDA